MISAPVFVLLGATIGVYAISYWVEELIESRRRELEEEARIQRVLDRIRSEKLERQLMELVHRGRWRP